MWRLSFLLCLVWSVSTSFVVSQDVSIQLTPTIEHPIGNTTGFTFYNKQLIQGIAGNTYHLRLDQYYSAIKVTSSGNSSSNIFIKGNNESYTTGMVVDNKWSAISPSFIIFQKLQNTLSIKVEATSKYKIELFYAPPLDLTTSSLRYKNQGCNKPQTILQSEWRIGLPAPTSGRQPTVVKHCIIHHSAGSNSDTNYTNTIRNIYLLHTESNGWDDIGYNFVVAPNGTIFSGRDSENVDDEDNIQGAHFCGKNSGTMGICLLGNYSKTSPTAAMKESLYSLLSWKLNKENISAIDSFNHPNSLSNYLGCIDIHQHGCPTQCPGDSVALMLPEIKTSVQNILDECNNVVSAKVPPKKTYKQLVYPNPSKGRFYIMVEKEAKVTSYQIINPTGQIVESNNLQEDGLVTTQVSNGFYVLQLFNKEGKIGRHKLKIQRD